MSSLDKNLANREQMLTRLRAEIVGPDPAGKPVSLASALRVVVDSHLRTPTTAKILQGGCLIATAETDAEKKAALSAAGAEVVCLSDANGRVDLKALLEFLAQRGINEVHVEAGPRLSGIFLKVGLVDELLCYMAPCVLGSDARGWFDDLALISLDQKIELKFQDVRMIGSDLRIIARPSSG